MLKPFKGEFKYHRLFSPRQAAVQAAGSAGMELKNIVDFYRQWKEIG